MVADWARLELALASERNALKAERMSVRQKSVLMVDDGPLIRQKLCEMLIRDGDFDICGEAENGRKAIEKAQQLRPDLIIMDLSMPGMNGLEAGSVCLVLAWQLLPWGSRAKYELRVRRSEVSWNTDHMIEALATNGSNHSLHIGSLPRGARCRQNFADAHLSHPFSEVIAKDSIAPPAVAVRSTLRSDGRSH